MDDLDAGFAIAEAARSKLRVEGKGLSGQETDQGLPIHEFGFGSRLPSEWSRATRSTAWGKYRRTLALIKGGSGAQMAVFTAELPRSGAWELEYHLPAPTGRSRRPSSRGTWKLNLVDVSGNQAIEFDADTADSGWNSLGTFEVAAGKVQIEVTDETEGRYVIADAIRWRPLSGVAADAGP